MEMVVDHMSPALPRRTAYTCLLLLPSIGLDHGIGSLPTPGQKGGASGIIGSETVVTSPPDGYTLLFAPSSHATLKELYPSMPFDPLREFTPIATVARTPYVLVVHPGLGVKTVADLYASAARRSDHA